MAPVTRSFNGNVAIPDNNPTGIQNTLVVDGVAAADSISTITVSVTITHTFDSDLDLRLIDPDGNVIELSQGNGDQNNNYTATIFDDSAATAIAEGLAPFAGSFRPDQPLSGLYPGTINGNWTLAVSDNSGGDVGALKAWSITITPNAPPRGVAINATTTTLDEGTSTASNIKVGNIVVADDGVGVNHLSLVGADAASFTILRGQLFLKAGTVLDFETKSSYQVAVAVDDPTNGGTPDATSSIYTLKVSDVSPETILGKPVSETLTGNSDVNLIFGFDGDDTLVGLLGNDVLTGGKGKDKFLFNTALNPEQNVDTIADFQHGKDRIELDHVIFTSLTTGVLKDKFFTVGKHAGDQQRPHRLQREKRRAFLRRG